jgi:diguanylate cyclase (GGDEF)-like protein
MTLVKDKLGNPFSLYDKSGKKLFQSHDESELSELTAFDYDYINEDGEFAYRLRIHRDITSLGEQMEKFMLYAGSIALAITLVIVFIAIAVFRKSLIQPLEKITDYFGEIVEKKSMLADTISVEGNREVVDLVRNLNSMTSHMNELNQRLEGMAYQDALTTIPNRLAFNERLEELTRFSRKNDEGFCIFIIDLNRFKEINDNMGHDVGDELLKQVAGKISQKTRESDLFARIGGDEFGIIFPGLTTINDAEIIAKNILASATEETTIKRHRIRPSLSIGFSFYKDNSTDVAETLRQADQEMYRAKKSGCGYSYRI